MKNMTNWVLAATLVIICGASVLTSCSNDISLAISTSPSSTSGRCISATI